MNPPDLYGAVVTAVDRPTLPGPLNGLRVGIKDLIAVKGVPRLCGAPEATDTAPQPRDAGAVARLVAAGARIVATTATHQFGWGVTTPGVGNPRAPGRIAGGSSGGSAAALAAGLVDGALGTDTAGSIRIPAACCGVVGLKTTEGLVPRDGVQPLAPSFDTVGPMARDVATLVALQAALTGADLSPAVPSVLRVGVVAEVAAGPLDPAVRRALDDEASALRSAGARIVSVSLPRFEQVRAATMTVLAAEEFSTHQATLTNYRSSLSARVVEALESGGRIANDAVLAARRELAVFRDALGGVFAGADVLLVPALACVVPAVGQETVVIEGATERTSRALTRLNSPFSGAGVPAGAVPVARDSNGAPIGLQVVGAWRAEATVLGVMGLIEELAGGAWPAVE